MSTGGLQKKDGDEGDTLPLPSPGDAGSAPHPLLSESSRLASGSVLAGHLRVVRLLGRGGMGEVYLSEGTRVGPKVALTVLAPELARHPQYLQRFRREARAASALSHPNVCVIHEVGEGEDGSPFICMEYIEGRSLDARLREGQIPIPEIVAIGIQVTDALDAAHSQGIVHRDIKSANVCIDARGHIKVLDFGLAKRLPDHGAPSRETPSLANTKTGTLLGTPAYMSPEQALARTVDHRSDLFSVGVVLYELVAGRLPFSGANVGELIDRIVHAQPEAMARFNYELPAELERIVRKCLEKSVERRYQSARDLLVDLKSLGRELEQGGAATPGALVRERPGAGEAAPRALSPAGVVPAAAVLRAGESSNPVALPAEALPGSDVFLSYSVLDDQPIAGRQGWISQFNRYLKVRLEQLSGEPVRIWPQPNPLGRGEAPPEIRRHLCDVKTLVSVLSPPFVKSDGCRDQMSAFWKAAEERGFLLVDRRPRVLKVVKSPVEEDEVPRDVAPLLSRLKSFEFFEWDADTGRLREFDEAFGELARQRYHERIYDVAYEIRHVLKHLGVRPGSTCPPTAGGGKVIFLAATTADLAAQRDALARELTELGHQVVPEKTLPIIATDLEKVVRDHLEGSDLAIHLVGDRYGFVPEDTDLSVVALQNRLAAEASAARGLRRFIWMPRGLKPRDERQETFIRELVRNPDAHRGAEVITDTIENLKTLLRERWKREAAGAKAPAGGAGGPPRVYLICDPQDEEAIRPLEDFFYQAGVEVSLPAFAASAGEAQETHLRNLTECDAVLIYYGAAGNHWVDFKARDIQKAAGYRNAVPFKACAVYVAPPSSPRKERFRSLTVEVLRQEEGVAMGLVARWVEKVKG